MKKVIVCLCFLVIILILLCIVIWRDNIIFNSEQTSGESEYTNNYEEQNISNDIESDKVENIIIEKHNIVEENKEDNKKEETKDKKKESSNKSTNKKVEDAKKSTKTKSTTTASNKTKSTTKSTKKKSSTSSSSKKATSTTKKKTTTKKTTSDSTSKKDKTNKTEVEEDKYWCYEGGNVHYAGDDENEHGYYNSWDDAWEACKKHMNTLENSCNYKVSECFCGKFYYWIKEH